MQPTKIYKVFNKNVKKEDITFAKENQGKFLSIKGDMEMISKHIG